MSDERAGVAQSSQAIILAAGQGTRMKSSRPKVLHEVLGRAMIERVVEAALQAGIERVVIIVGHGAEALEERLSAHPQSSRFHYAVQEEQLGTGHAVWAAREYFEEAPQYSVILSGDVPNMRAEDLRAFIESSLRAQASMSLMTAVLEDAASYGRILRGEDGAVQGIVEYKDASEEQRAIREINAGFYLLPTDYLAARLAELMERGTDNAQGEYYFTDLVAMTIADGRDVHGWTIEDPRSMQGVNTRVQLAEATRTAQQRINERWMVEGVTMLDPSRVLIDERVELARDVTLYPDVQLRGVCRVGEGSVIESGSMITDSQIGAGVHIKANCYLDHAQVGDESNIGPFAHLRPGSKIGQRCKVGNFVEIKKTQMGDGAKASHLTYLGDAEVGEGANIGAGTITCNYDGYNKHRSTIGAGAFIGSNSALVAPVQIGDGAYVGAGSTITGDVPSDGLGVARGQQRNIDNWARRWRQRHNKKTES